MQREEAVERCVINGWSAEKPCLQALAHEWDRAEEACDNGRAPEGHLTPRQNIAHEACRHHQNEDEHTDNPCDLTWGFI